MYLRKYRYIIKDMQNREHPEQHLWEYEILLPDAAKRKNSTNNP